MAGVVVVGESLIDVVETADGSRTEHVGGSAANVAVAMARLGQRVRLATSWGPDRHGELIAAHLAASGVELACDPHAVSRTGTAVARIGADGAASYDFDLEWRLGPVPAEPVPEVLHICSLGAVMEPGADDVAALVDRWAGVAALTYDVNARPAVTGSGPEVRQRVEALVARATLVKASDEDLAALYPDLSCQEAMAHLLDLGAAVVVTTLGERGAEWLDADGLVGIESPPVDVVDTIGAGDTFGAALVSELVKAGRIGPGGVDTSDGLVGFVLHQAARAAAITVSRAGADPPYAGELSPPEQGWRLAWE